MTLSINVSPHDKQQQEHTRRTHPPNKPHKTKTLFAAHPHCRSPLTEAHTQQALFAMSGFNESKNFWANFLTSQSGRPLRVLLPMSRILVFALLSCFVAQVFSIGVFLFPLFRRCCAFPRSAHLPLTQYVCRRAYPDYQRTKGYHFDRIVLNFI
jgi:hypothetical protein